MQEEKCYVAYSPKKEEEHPPHPERYRLPDGVTLNVRLLAPSLWCDVMRHPLSLPFLSMYHRQIGAERFRAPEILFRPELIGSEEKGRWTLQRQGSVYNCCLVRSSLCSQYVHDLCLARQGCTSVWCGA